MQDLREYVGALEDRACGLIKKELGTVWLVDVYCRKEADLGTLEHRLTVASKLNSAYVHFRTDEMMSADIMDRNLAPACYQLANVMKHDWPEFKGQQ